MVSPWTATLATLMSGAILATAADADIYWAVQHFPGKPAPIGCARDNGSRTNAEFIHDAGDDVNSLSADRRFVYWRDDATDSIGRAKANGRKVKRKFIRDASGGYYGLAADDGFLYWSTDNATIARAAVDGSGIDRAFVADAEAGSVAVGGGRIVWHEYGSISSAAADASPTGSVFTGFDPRASNPASLATDGARVFWTWSGAAYGSGFDPFKVSSVNIDGTGFVDAFVPNVDAFAVAANGKHVYWADPQADAIGRVNVDGTGLKRKFIRTKNPFAVAVGTAGACPRPKR